MNSYPCRRHGTLHASFSLSFHTILLFVNSNRVSPATIDSRLKRRGAKLEIKLFSPPPLSLSLSLLFFLFDLEERKIAFGLSAHVFVSQDRKKGGYRRGDGNLLLFLFAKKKRQILDQVCDAIRPERRRKRRREPLSEGPSSSFLFFSRGVLGSFPFSPLLGDPGPFSSSSSSLEAPSTPRRSFFLFSREQVQQVRDSPKFSRNFFSLSSKLRRFLCCSVISTREVFFSSSLSE